MTQPDGQPADLASELPTLLERLDAELAAARNAEEARAAAAKLLGKKGALTALQKKLGTLPAPERPAFGAALNQAKADAGARLDTRLAALEKDAFERSLAGPPLDPTLPPRGLPHGHAHPLMSTMHDIVDIFGRLGFHVAEGPEVEDDFHNFEALNFPPDHPARDMQDTLFVDAPGSLLMRTHTSPVQIRTMLAQEPPVRVVIPGAVYRHDDDATHSPRFHQVEGLLVDDHTTLADLKGCLTLFVQEFFGADVTVRFRASFFPFTEPSGEIDCRCVVCRGKGCRVCKGSGWLEILGCGMVDPAVFRHVGYDPEKWQGFAFGMGVDRLAMLRHGMSDIRLLYENDLRFLRQFQ
ncbi:MAG: phenylalanine--tRNA ligase subunit alpha [Deltaproteobacteria bacterium]|nr:phenylalanine--tRNA ligase subunit alpha [Deltaproteobacteria bacterium]